MDQQTLEQLRSLGYLGGKQFRLSNIPELVLRRGTHPRGASCFNGIQMRKTLCLFVLLAAAACAADNFRPLFNGKNLDGWVLVGAGNKPDFTVKNDMIETQPGDGLLSYTKEKLGNGTLRVVYRMSTPKGNSGIFIRIPTQAADEEFAIHHGIEVQIDNNDNDWHCTGVLYSMTKAMARPYKPAGEWNTMEITMDGLRTIVHVNGVLVTDYDGTSPVPPRVHPYEPQRGPRPETGYIAIQHHDDSAVFDFKEVSFRKK